MRVVSPPVVTREVRKGGSRRCRSTSTRLERGADSPPGWLVEVLAGPQASSTRLKVNANGIKDRAVGCLIECSKCWLERKQASRMLREAHFRGFFGLGLGRREVEPLAPALDSLGLAGVDVAGVDG